MKAEDPIVEYIIVNKDLLMSPGKIAGQVAHAQTLIDMEIKHYADSNQRNFYLDTDIQIPADWLLALEWYEEWYKDSQTKIILRAKESVLRKAINLGAIVVRDNGLTEIPKGSLTVVAFYPQPKSNLREFTKRLQLL